MAGVGLKDRMRKMITSVDDLDTLRLHDRFVGLSLTPLAEATARVPMRVGGEIKRLRIVPRSGIPSLDVLIGDGTGEVHAVFTGRRSLGGVAPGRGMVVEGVGHHEHGELVVLNPAYTLLP
jgi:hypothetical protein